jgi:hypothetical protein
VPGRRDDRRQHRERRARPGERGLFGARLAAGIDTDGLTPAAASIVAYGRGHNTLTGTPHVGDAMVYQYDGSSWAAHVNIVVGVRADGFIETVGGGEGAPEIVRFSGWHAPGNWDGPVTFVRPLKIDIEEFAGDWDGNGTTTVGIHRGSTFFLSNTDGNPAADITFDWGDPNWIPITGDWDGSGKTSVGGYDPATGTFHLRSSTDPTTFTETTFGYGDPYWIP